MMLLLQSAILRLMQGSNKVYRNEPIKDYKYQGTPALHAMFLVTT